MSEVDELKPCPCGGKIRTLTLLGTVYFICRKCKAKLEFTDVGLHVDEQRARWNTRAESPDSVVVTTNEQGQAVAVTRQDWEGQILSTIWESPPPPVAADGELIERLNNQYESMYLATAVNHEMYLQAADFIKEISTILQSRSTPPPVAGGDVDYCAMFTSLCEGLEIDPAIVGVSTLAGIKAVGKAIASQAKSAALQHQDCVNEIVNQHQALLYADETKHPGESRFETALRYIQMAEEGACDNTPKQSLERKNG